MIVKKTLDFSKKLNKLIDKGLLTLEDYKKTVNLFKTDLNHSTLRTHKINCEKNKQLISITVNNSQLRILILCKKCEGINKYILMWIGKHREYELIIKNKKNCKRLFIDCLEIDKL